MRGESAPAGRTTDSVLTARASDWESSSWRAGGSRPGAVAPGSGLVASATLCRLHITAPTTTESPLPPHRISSPTTYIRFHVHGFPRTEPAPSFQHPLSTSVPFFRSNSEISSPLSCLRQSPRLLSIHCLNWLQNKPRCPAEIDLAEPRSPHLVEGGRSGVGPRCNEAGQAGRRATLRARHLLRMGGPQTEPRNWATKLAHPAGPPSRPSLRPT
jgi:hypothetical protein